MDEPACLALSTVLAVHDEQLAEHGGHAGLRDAALLEFALGGPRNAHAYGERSLPTLAASLALGIARNRPFVDGHKQTGLVVAELFLELNARAARSKSSTCGRVKVLQGMRRDG